MRQIIILIICTLSVFHECAHAQCDTCTPDSSCISADGFPMMCPLTPPDAVVNEFYTENITFYLPSQVNDPASGVNATLLEVTISSVSGLPFGLAFSFNDNDAVFLPSSGENFGCATICGTPLIPGIYQVLINADVLINALGFETSLQQSFSTSITVLAAEGQTGSFSFDQNAGCGSIDVNFSASFSAPAPAQTSYAWDFGNGQTSTTASPPTVSYTEPGAYSVWLTTTVASLSLEQVYVSNLNDNWSGDVDDFINTADPYFQLLNGNGNAVFTSGTVDNTTNTVWNLTPITLGDPPYSIQFFDDDDFSQDDALGSVGLTLEPGQHFFDAGNGTTGTYTIALFINTEIADSAAVTVFPLPNDTLLIAGDIATLVEPSPSTTFWLQNNLPAAGLFGSLAQLTESGVYSVELTNAFGCASSTNEVVYCAPVAIEYSALAGELYVADEYESYQWYFNGLPIDGATNSYHLLEGAGNYAVQVTTSFGCDIESSVYVVENSIHETTERSLFLFPNPVCDFVAVRGAGPGQWKIFDAAGKIRDEGSTPSAEFSINTNVLPPGVYTLRTPGGSKSFIKL